MLSQVDRQMLLVFKTNDLLRSIDYALGTSGERRSLITMSRSCIRAVHSEELRHCHNWVQRLHVHIGRHWLETKLSFYSFYLWLCGFIWGPQYL
jgi:aarF domain-containing kinase